MTCRELRSLFIRFYESKGHTVHASGSLIPIDVTGKVDESLLFNGAGMIQFKPYFRGVATPPSKRLVTAQKCVRTGDIDEVGDDSHLTFFEMLGNFSFGDYFKQDAIDYSWEFLTSQDWLSLDPRRLSFTVFEDDDEAAGIWSKHLTAAGIAPSSRIMRLGEESNYWPAGALTAGPPGPCGPNTEMFYWTGAGDPPGIKEGDYNRDRWIADDDAKNWLEIGNDVFIQYEWQGKHKNADRPSDGYQKTGMPSLPFESVDTGSGLERAVAVISGFKSVYETDAFVPIIQRIAQIFGANPETDSQTRAFRIIADHVRTACFCIADGILPANNGRGYVLRRLIRRAVLKGQRVLGFSEAFMAEVSTAVIDTFGDHYTELVQRQIAIKETLLSEEQLFRRTLQRGSELLADEIALVESILDGETAFKLYDTFGFPLEVTQEICKEAKINVDVAGYEVAMLRAQQLSRGAQGETSAYIGTVAVDELLVADATQIYDPYHAPSGNATIIGIRTAQDKSFAEIAITPNPLYAKSGGQIDDEGDIGQCKVAGVRKIGALVWCRLSDPSHVNTLILGSEVIVRIDATRRASVMRNHTATHLLHAALRERLGTHVAQAGSAVGPDSLSFDFSHTAAMSAAEIAEVETRVNEQIMENIRVVTHVDIPIAEARERGAMALFGEKYGATVRMIEIGDFSKELCGGTHVGATGELGLFKILSEASSASGVRRIEAVSGNGAYAHVNIEIQRVKEIAALLKTSPANVVTSVERTIALAKEERKKREKAEMSAISGSTEAEIPLMTIGKFTLWVRNFGETDPKVAGSVIENAANGKPDQITLGAVVTDGRVQLICKIGVTAVTNGAHAGNLLRTLAAIVGGGGGGKPEFATAGGKDATKVDDALDAAPGLIAGITGS